VEARSEKQRLVLRTGLASCICLCLFSGIGSILGQGVYKSAELRYGPEVNLSYQSLVATFLGALLLWSFIARSVNRKLARVEFLVYTCLFWFTAVNLSTIFNPATGFSSRLDSASVLANVLLGACSAVAFTSATVGCIAILLVACVDSLVAIVDGVARVDGIVSGGVFRASGALDSPLELATLLTVVFVCGLARSTSRDWAGRSLWLATATIGAGLATCWTRNAAFAVTVVSSLIQGLRGQFFKAALFLVIGMMAYGLTTGVRLSGNGASSVERSDSGRVAQMNLAWKAFLVHPLFGTGPGSYRVKKRFVPGVDAKTDLRGSPDTKNVALALLNEYGIVGLVVVSFLTTGILICLAKSRSETAYTLLLPAIACLAIIGIADDPYMNPDRPIGNRLIGFVAGLIIIEGGRAQFGRSLSTGVS